MNWASVVIALVESMPFRRKTFRSFACSCSDRLHQRALRGSAVRQLRRSARAAARMRFRRAGGGSIGWVARARVSAVSVSWDRSVWHCSRCVWKDSCFRSGRVLRAYWRARWCGSSGRAVRTGFTRQLFAGSGELWSSGRQRRSKMTESQMEPSKRIIRGAISKRVVMGSTPGSATARAAMVT